jgi:hypothetical protein
MARAVPLTEVQRYNQAAWGAQDRLVLVSVPAAAAQSLVGKNLVDCGALTVAGTYEVLIPLSGISTALEVHLTATIAAGTVSSALNTLYYVSNASSPSTWVNKTAGSGAGSLTTTTRQSSTISTLRGEQFARMTLTLASSPNVTFTQAEYNGL